MIKYFRQIRQKLIDEQRFRKYLLYAAGEIILVVIGILIALAINNHAENKKLRIKELHYLSGIQADLQLNLKELENYMATREKAIHSAEIILDIFENKKPADPDTFNLHNLNVQIWYPFNKNNNTYQELINSGNFAIISGDSIKNLLLNMEAGYKQIEFIERHSRHDFENYVYPNYFNTTDLKSDIDNYTFQVSNGAQGNKTSLSPDKMKTLLHNQTLKNGFVLSMYNNNLLTQQYRTMLRLTEDLMRLISVELDKGY